MLEKADAAEMAEKGDAAVEKGDAAMEKGDAAVEKDDALETLASNLEA
jgi:hypothetical protein